MASGHLAHNTRQAYIKVAVGAAEAIYKPTVAAVRHERLTLVTAAEPLGSVLGKHAQITAVDLMQFSAARSQHLRLTRGKHAWPTFNLLAVA